MKEIPFNRYRVPFFIFTTFLILLSIGISIFKGFNLSIDFTGGIVVEFSQSGKEISPEEVREVLKQSILQDFAVQQTTNTKDIIIKIGIQKSDSSDHSGLVANIKTLILNNFTQTDVDFTKIDFVSPQIGKELVIKAIIAVLISLFAVLLYVSIRFEVRYSIGAVIALFHDVILTIGFISIFNLPFDVSTIAAILTVVGYSINDSVVIFDRIRENFKLITSASSNDSIIQKSLNDTFSRTITTSLTTLLAVLSIILLGGDILRPFALIVFFGIFVGTISSIFVSPILVYNRKPN